VAVPILTNVYVDGFNLYNGLARRAKRKGLDQPEFRWLDLLELSRRMLPGSEIQTVWYFTSFVKNRAENPGAGERQEVFLEALKTLPCLEIERGKFQRNKVWRRLVDEPETSVHVIDFKEKGSDVNLASRLLADAYEGVCKRAAVISSDSDLKTPITIAAAKLTGGVVVLNPNTSHARSLESVATDYRRITNKSFRASLFPEVVDGRISKPPEW
jgi:hypothetical protein